MPREIRILLTEEQGGFIEKTASATGTTVQAVVEEAVCSVLRCLNIVPTTTASDEERFRDAYLPEDRWREVQSGTAPYHWSVETETR